MQKKNSERRYTHNYDGFSYVCFMLCTKTQPSQERDRDKKRDTTMATQMRAKGKMEKDGIRARQNKLK